ncbi:hypothetical protein BSKO_07629 [Bryopsis sp. KO-2023]|nr:hypothetical protein BSKO_07629 [Bryopsis sp. KO-2023]
MAAVVFFDDEPPKEGEVVVAVDFGTSRTAYCWALIGNETEDIQVEQLSGGISALDVKTPTSVLIDKDGVRGYGFLAEETYVNEREPDHDDWLLFKWFKMSLHNTQEEDPLVKSVCGKELPVSIVLQRALEFVRQRAIQTLLSKNILTSPDPFSVHWVLTLPAIWSDKAKTAMRRAAFRAGLIEREESSRLLLALEPECAAIASQCDRSQANLFTAGSKFLMADCGGGTLDITAHEVLNTAPLQLKELMVPAGGPHGAVQVDKNFFDFFAQFWGVSRYEEMQTTFPNLILGLAKQWEEKKRLVFASPDSGAFMRFGEACQDMGVKPALFAQLCENWNAENPARPVIRKGKVGMTLTHDLVKSFFMQPVQDVVNKIDEVVAGVPEGVDRVLLAGGFANCTYLKTQLAERLEGRNLELVVGNHPDLLIVKGAALFGARPMEVIPSRKCKYTVGVSALVQYDDRIHGAIKPPGGFVRLGGKTMFNIFSIHGRAGDDVRVDERTPTQWYRPESETDTSCEVEILCARDNPRGNVIFADDAGVRTLAKFPIFFDMSKPPQERVIGVDFSFGKTEVCCYVKDRETGRELHRIQPDFKIF